MHHYHLFCNSPLRATSRAPVLARFLLYLFHLCLRIIIISIIIIIIIHIALPLQTSVCVLGFTKSIPPILLSLMFVSTIDKRHLSFH
jgi:hypothetical protein